MTDNANSALIIGLGGTGQWVLTYIKNNLLERFENLPPQIKLLAFDTTSEESEVYKSESQEQLEEEVRVGGVRLIPGEEFIYLGGNIKNICEQIPEGRFSHISSWLRAEDYLRTLGDDDFNLSRGAGQRRQFGRMALFLDIVSMNTSKVFGKISDAIQSIVSAQEKTQSIDIYIVSSIAGGTGSGMLIDIAHLTRLLAQKNTSADVTVRGFIALHNTFQSVIRVEPIKAQAYAAIREVNRFLTMFGEGYPINYSENSRIDDLRTIYTSKLFDNCFLVDAERTQFSLKGEKPQYGVYPSIADSITMLLDPSSGDTFQQHYKNVNNRVIDIQKRKPYAIYSSIGALSYVFPVEDIIRTATLRFAQQFLSGFFAQQSDPTDNQEKLVDDVQTFLQQATSHSGIHNTVFVQQLALLAKQANVDDETSIQKISSQGSRLAELFEPSGEDAESKKRKFKLYELTQVNLLDKVQPSKQYGDSYESASVRIPQQIDSFKKEFLGELNPLTGKRRQGKIHLLFDDIQNINSKRFHDLLQEQILSILNERKSVNQRGYLGYVYDYLGQTEKIIEKFIALIERAREQRNSEAQIIYAREDARRALERLESSTKKQNFIGALRQKLSSKSEGDYAQEDYINSEQYIVDLEIEDVLFSELIRSAQGLNKVTSAIKADVNHWLSIWITGNVSSKQQSGVLWRIQNLKRSLEQQREEKKLIPVHKYLTDEKFEDNLYQELSKEKYNHLMARFSWRFDVEGSNTVLNLELDGIDLPKTLDDETLVEQSYRRLLDAIRPYFESIKNQNIATRLEKMYHADKLAEEMLNLSAPMLNVQKEDDAAIEQEVKTFISVDRKATINFVNETEDYLQRKSNTRSDAQVIDAMDPYRCVVISTQDLIGVDAVRAFADARVSYDNQTDEQGQKQQLHIFPAEIHAVEYERRLGEHPFYYFRKKPHQFSHRVVMLLEDLDRFELFMLAYAMGIIQIEDSPNHRRLRYYVLRLKRERRFDKAFSFPLSEPAARPSLFDAMHTFIFKKPNKPGLDVSSLIASADGDLFVDKERIEKAIDLYEVSIQWGLEYPGRQFARFLKNLKWPDTMQSLLPVLESEFRYFLMDSTNFTNKSFDKEKTQTDVQQWLSNMRDLNVQYHQEIVDQATELVIQTRMLMQNNAPDINRLRRFLEENVILEKVPDFTNSKKTDERDLGILMHIMIWDYIKRLEQRNV